VTVHQYRYTVLYEPAEEGGYVVTCPSLPGLVTEGDTLEEARDMAADAIRGYLESLAKDGLPIPPEDPPPWATLSRRRSRLPSNRNEWSSCRSIAPAHPGSAARRVSRNPAAVG
jgi:antitoxin HicB